MNNDKTNKKISIKDFSENTEVSVLNSEDFEKIKVYLPATYQVMIHEKIKGAISIRQIRSVIAGEQKDYHGVIDHLLDIAFAEKSKIDLRKERVKTFLKK